MKYLPLILLFLFACQMEKPKESKTIKTSIGKEKPKPAPIDTNSFEYFLKMTDEWGQIPMNLVNKFIAQKWIDTTDYYRGYYGEKGKHKKIEDFILVNYSVVMGGVCGYEILTTYTQTGEIISSLNVGEACDQDYSRPEYSFSSYTIYSNLIVEVYYSVEKPIDYDEFYSDTSDFHDDVEKITETTYSHFLIESNGTFKPIRKDYSSNVFVCSERILNKEDLQKKSQSELRIMRNEIFARKGYIFKSQDLQKHFTQFEWYKPKFEKIEVIKLTLIEKYNVNKIKELEKQ